jgi:hypothetical protein
MGQKKYFLLSALFALISLQAWASEGPGTPPNCYAHVVELRDLVSSEKREPDMSFDSAISNAVTKLSQFDLAAFLKADGKLAEHSRSSWCNLFSVSDSVASILNSSVPKSLTKSQIEGLRKFMMKYFQERPSSFLDVAIQGKLLLDYVASDYFNKGSLALYHRANLVREDIRGNLDMFKAYSKASKDSAPKVAEREMLDIHRSHDLILDFSTKYLN